MASDVKYLEANFGRLQQLLPGKRVVLGCHLWDSSNPRLIPLDEMKR